MKINFVCTNQLIVPKKKICFYHLSKQAIDFSDFCEQISISVGQIKVNNFNIQCICLDIVAPYKSYFSEIYTVF